MSSTSGNKQSLNTDTIAVRAGIETDQQFGSITPPLYLSSNYSFKGFDEKRQYDYSRSGNPTRDTLAQTLAKLESGVDGVITSSGMSAIFLVLQLLQKDDTIIAPHDCYGGSFRLFKSFADKGYFKLLLIDQNDPKALAHAFAQKPKLIWVETPSNPLLRITDIAQIVTLAKTHNTLVAVDNTFLSPIHQKPLLLGADIVVHSTTKYINGHSDLVGGAVVAKDPKIAEDLKWWANCTGITGAAFDSFLTLRGLRTLDVRLARHETNAARIVDFLQSHSSIEKVYYPGLKDHPGHAVAKRQQTGFGSMISFKVKGDIEQIKALLTGLNIFSLAESLGGVESLICHPSTMTHAAVALPEQITAGITQNLLRISVGIENVQDLIEDLESALNKLNEKTNQTAELKVARC